MASRGRNDSTCRFLDNIFSRLSTQYNIDRSAVVSIPETSDGAKLPVIIYLHGNGGQGSVKPFADWLGDDCILVAPNGYERSW